jgi:hypothetical protein
MRSRGSPCRRAGRTIPRRSSHSDTALHITLVILHTKYTGARQNDSNVYVYAYDTFGLIGTALSKKLSAFQPSSLKAVPISPNAW